MDYKMTLEEMHDLRKLKIKQKIDHEIKMIEFLKIMIQRKSSICGRVYPQFDMQILAAKFKLKHLIKEL